MLDRLKRDIMKLEERVENAIASIDPQDLQNDDREAWYRARDATRASLTAETDFVAAASFLDSRYIDLRTPLMLEIATDRIAYLRALLNELGEQRPEEPGAHEQTALAPRTIR